MRSRHTAAMVLVGLGEGDAPPERFRCAACHRSRRVKAWLPVGSVGRIALCKHCHGGTMAELEALVASQGGSDERVDEG